MATQSSANQWFVSYHDLDPDQRRLVDNGVFADGSSIGWVLGPAGSGKTIVLINALAKAQKAGKSVAFISYTHSLLNMARQGLDASVPSMTYNKVRSMAPCDLAVVDEVQDVPMQYLQSVRAKAKQVILAGDITQRIYDSGADEKELVSLVGTNSHKLVTAHRLTPKVLGAAKALYPTSFDMVIPSGKPVVDIELYKTSDAELGKRICYEQATGDAAKGRTSAILLPKRDSIVDFANWALNQAGKAMWIRTNARPKQPDFGSLNDHLRNNGIPLMVVQNNFGDLGEAFRTHCAILQTYHSSKGLDYHSVCIPNIAASDASPELAFQKALFFVALTRASSALTITHSEHIQPRFMSVIEPFCTPMDPARALSVNSALDDEDEF